MINRRSGAPLQSHDLEDVAQESLLKVWTKVAEFRGQSTLEGWLYGFCLNAFRNAVRRRRHGTLDTEPAADPTKSYDFDELESLLSQLGPPAEPVIRLKHVDGLTFAEIASDLGLHVSTAKERYYTGIQWLRSRLAGRRREMLG